MVRGKTEKEVMDVLGPHLLPGETVKYYAFGVKTPPMWLVLLLYLLAILPGVIVVALLSKNYIAAMTEKRFLALEVAGKSEVKGVLEYELGATKHVSISKGPLMTHIRIDDPERPFVAKFHRAAMKTNKAHAEAMADELHKAA